MHRGVNDVSNFYFGSPISEAMADIDKQESASIVDLKNAATKIILPKESAVITLGEY